MNDQYIFPSFSKIWGDCEYVDLQDIDPSYYQLLDALFTDYNETEG